MINKRKNGRFELAEDVMFADQLTHPYCYFGGSTINYSMSGICLVSRYEVISGDQLCIRIIGDHLHSCTSVDDLTCMAEVRWCRPICESREPAYHIGLHYLGQVPALFKP
ncbi:MAG: hypothetical protein BA862_00010 [Desulfobulbaceae bacterium S3730MH12]|nr:MAG: hypothetical protein BA866_05375 [Desulfobulbaceae bacterium S5133MH15]OEU57850.1 MAG: hypothetical protein BA862_00010 [Desulfobulbaceae bacterium S3730MH12]OEU80337.1 MAG: hypothetical protein BA873_07640 [Desulfobulbaceae bacterium C00003063]